MTTSTSYRACIVGIGQTAYTRDPGLRTTDLALQLEASMNAIKDAGLERKEIDGLIAPIVGGKTESFIANLSLSKMRYAVTSHTGGAAAVAGLQSAAMAVSCGVADYVLIPAGFRTYSGGAVFEAYGSEMGSGEVVHMLYHPFGAFGAVPTYALVANRYMEMYGVTPEQTGAVAVTMRRHAQFNTAALMYGRPMTMEDYLASPMVSTPFRLVDCALPNDGAAAVVVTSVERARDLRGPRVEILGVAEGRPYPVDDLTNRKDLLQIGVGAAARAAFGMAKLTPGDMDFMQLYDSFTTNVLREIEELGICGRGEAGGFVQDGNIALGGSLPANTDGGMLSGGSTQGMSQVIEAVRQLRGEATGRQVPDAELGVVVGMGGGWGTAAVAVLGAGT